jgi:hypothetical protein
VSQVWAACVNVKSLRPSPRQRRNLAHAVPNACMATSWAACALWLWHTLSSFTRRERCRRRSAITFAAGLEQAAAGLQVRCADIARRQRDGAGDTTAIHLCILSHAFLGLQQAAVGRLRAGDCELRKQQGRQHAEDGRASRNHLAPG